MADLLISRGRAGGVALIKSTDPFDTLEIHRIERSAWRQTPETPGVYLLYGINEDAEPDPRFRVLIASAWRRPTLDPDATTHDAQVKVGEAQDALVAGGVLDADSLTFTRDHVFDHWTVASRIVGGKAQYSGGRHWQPLAGCSASA